MIRISHVTHSHITHIRDTNVLHSCDMPRSYVQDDVYRDMICVCHVTHSHIAHIRDTNVVDSCDMPRSYAQDDLYCVMICIATSCVTVMSYIVISRMYVTQMCFTRVTCLGHMCKMMYIAT